MARAGQDQALDLVDGRVRALRRELEAIGNQYDDSHESDLAKAISAGRANRPVLGLLLAEKVLRRALLDGTSTSFEDFVFRFGAHVKASVGLPGLPTEDRVVLATGAAAIFAGSQRLRRQKDETDAILDRLPVLDTTDLAWRRQFGMTEDEFGLKVSLMSGARQTGRPRPHRGESPQAPRILLDRPTAADGELSAPSWLSLPEGDPNTRIAGSKNWPGIVATADDSRSISRGWTLFEEGRYRSAQDQLWNAFAGCGDEWYPTRTQDGSRSWNWMRLVWILGQREAGELRNTRRASLSALDFAQRSVPSEADLLDHLIDDALRDYVAVDPDMRADWSVHALRVAVSTGVNAFDIYDGAGKADLRNAWSEHFRTLVDGMRQTHQMVESLTSEFKFRVQTLSQSASPDDQVQRRIVGPLRRLELFLDVEERSISSAVCEASAILTTQLAGENSLASDLATIKQDLVAVHDDVAQSESSLLQDLLGPALIAMVKTCEQRQEDLSRTSRPNIVATLLNRRLPLSSTVQAPFSVGVALQNDGNATAELVEANLSSLAIEVVGSSSVVVERIPPGAERVVKFEAVSMSDAPIALIECNLTWQDQLEQTFAAEFNLRAEDQRPTEWRADDVNPFRLGTIANPAKLVGRKDDLDALERVTAAGGSVAVTGLKRVGKSSLAKSLQARVRAYGWATDYLPLGQVLTGNPSASELVTALTETIYDAIQSADREILLPEPPPASAANFTRMAGRWIRQVSTVVRENDMHVLIALDDFDELPKALYEGPEADALFLFLRSVLDESWLSLMFIGSEVLPAILGAQAHKLNQVAPFIVSNFTSVTATRELLEERTKSRLDWQDASFNRAHFLGAGNPYYLTLLGQEVWQTMRDLDRTFVSVGDVDVAASRLEGSAAATHFLHLWSDSLAGLKSRARSSIVANAVLVSVAKGSGDQFKNVSRHHVQEAAISSVPSATGLEVGASIGSLMARGVLVGSDDLIRVGIPLASSWLRTTGATELERELVKMHEIDASGKQISSLDLIQLTTGLSFGGQSVSEVRLKAWLEQFSAPQQHLAFRAAELMLTEGFFSSTRMAQEVLPRLKNAVTSTEAWSVRESDSGGYAKNVYVLHHGLAGSGSPGFFATLIRLLKIKKSNIVTMEKLVSTTRGLTKPSVLLIADDLAGTGKQLGDVLTNTAAYFDEISAGPWRDNLNIVLAAAISATEDFPIPDRLDVELAIGCRLEERFSIYSDLCDAFATADERSEARDAFDAVGRSLLASAPRGFGGLGLLAATEGNCPNNAPPMFWKSGTHAGRKWMPLLERHL